MADISLIQDECFDDPDDGGEPSDGEGRDSDISNAQQEEEALTPCAKLEIYAKSENIFNRQMVPSILLEIFRDSSPDAIAADFSQIMDIIARLADDAETAVRTDLVQRIPHLAAACAEYAPRIPVLGTVVVDHLLPLIVKYLGDADNQVRKSTHSTLLTLMEQGLVPMYAIETHICPKVLHDTHADNLMDYHTGAVTLMCKMVPLLGREKTERLFLQRFSELCSNTMFYIRKICASSFGEFSAVVGRNAYENVLLPCFIKLCADEIWGVRKACAEVVMTVSCGCSPHSRRTTLAPAFVRLLQDQSRWVRMSAFQTLGPFISTFADPSIIGLTYNQFGELVLINPAGTEFRINSPAFTDANLKAAADFKQRFCQAQERIVNKNPPLLQQMFENSETSSPYSASNMLPDEKTDNNTTTNLDVNLDEKSNNDYSSTANNLAHSTNTNPPTNATMQLNAASKKPCDDSANSCGNIKIVIAGGIDGDKLAEFSNLEEKSSGDFKLMELETDNSVIQNTQVDSEEASKGDFSTQSSDVNSTVMKSIQENAEEEAENFENQIVEVDNSVIKNVKEETSEEDFSAQNFGQETNDVWDNEISTELADNMTKMLLELNNDKSDESEKSETREDDDLNKYNLYQYWYVSPDMPLDPTILKSCGSPKKCEPEERNFINQLDDIRFSNSWVPSMDETLILDRTKSWDDTVVVERTLEHKDVAQTIVPQLLIDHFVSMTDPGLAANTDNDMAYHCAFSLPAVALTLGKNNWFLLKKTCELLASDMQYKIRKTVASSLHELALILGQEMAAEHLLPIFDGFIKDLDEVRIGVLRHLAHFLKLIGPEKRNLYLPRLAEFLQTDNEWNWRFREELANQLLMAVPLFQPIDASKHIAMLAQELLCDKVFAVRQVALSLVTELVRHVSGEPNLTSLLLLKLAEEFAHSKRWARRQAFALLCSRLISKNALPPEQFATIVMPHLLDLSWDPVPNVRLAVSRTLSRDIIVHEYFSDVNSEQHEPVSMVLRRLQADKDRDVRQYAVPPVH